MKLEFEKGVIPEKIFKELGFAAFLSQFEFDLSLISHQVLRPLSQSDLKQHYQDLISLEAQLDSHNVDLKKQLDSIAELPNLDHLLPFYENQQLEVYHLFELGQFVEAEIQLCNLEKECPLPSNSEIVVQTREILRGYTKENYSSLLLSDKEDELQRKIEDLMESYERKISSIEKRVEIETGVRMIFPYPKEIGKDASKLGKLLKCCQLESEEKRDFWVFKFKPEEPLKQLLEEKTDLENSWHDLVSQKLAEINQGLSPLFTAFKAYYLERKKRTFQLLWLRAKRKHGWSFPSLQARTTFKLEKGCLPVLADLLRDQYQPLDVELKSGVNVLYGANMTGKTTVLKTVYFLANLVVFGLPVPAESLTLSFPHEVALQLKSSGEMQSGLSGFGDEIQFFCDHQHSDAIYLIDELFHSTDPQNGVLLSKIFLEEYSSGEAIYFCTSHYSEVQNFPAVNLFRMKDFDGDSLIEELKELMKNTPFQLEPVRQNQRGERLTTDHLPLQVALHFPLPEKIKQKLRKKLKA